MDLTEALDIIRSDDARLSSMLSINEGVEGAPINRLRKLRNNSQYKMKLAECAKFIAEVVHGAPSRFTDPARFSFAHGGKDGHPFPVPLKTYDESLNFLRTALDRAKVGIRTGSSNARVSDREKLDGFRRLEQFARGVESRMKPEANFDAIVSHEKAISRSLNGRSVFDDKPGRGQNNNPRQGSLF